MELCKSEVLTENDHFALVEGQVKHHFDDLPLSNAFCSRLKHNFSDASDCYHPQPKDEGSTGEGGRGAPVSGSFPGH